MRTRLQGGAQNISNEEKLVREKEIFLELKRKYNDRMQKVSSSLFDEDFLIFK